MTRDHLLLRFMYYICTGNKVGCDADTETHLEKALTALQSLEPLWTDDIAQLAGPVSSLIKEQVFSYLVHTAV